jgi:hypothetical protein
MKHFVTSTRIEIVGDVADTRVAIAVDKDTDPFKLLPDRIFAASKQVDGQIWAYLAKADVVGQLGRDRKE